MASVPADIAKNQLLALPGMRTLQQGRRRRRTKGVEQNAPAYAMGVFEKYVGLLERVRPIGGDLLEIGPGGNLGVAAQFLARDDVTGVTCIDVVRWETVGPAFYKALGVADVVDEVDYRWPVSIECTPFADESFDAIYSHACFEHFRDPAAAISEIARLLRPGGVTAHQIDLRDHRNMDEPLDFLRHPEWLWRAMVSRRPFYTNRWRRSDFITAFMQAGLEVVFSDASARTKITTADAARFQPPFAGKPLDDLAVVGCFIVARRH